MATCTSCRDVIDPGDVFCTSCGAKQDTLVESDGWSGPPEPPVSAGTTSFAGPLGPPPSASAQAFTGVSPIHDLPGSADVNGLLASDQLLGQAAPNTVYLGQRMMYEKEQQLEELTRCAAPGSFSR